MSKFIWIESDVTVFLNQTVIISVQLNYMSDAHSVTCLRAFSKKGHIPKDNLYALK